MVEKYPSSWKSWKELNETERRYAVADGQFWAKLNEIQRQKFLEEADWQELRLVPDAKQAKLGGLMSLDEMCSQFGLTSTQVWFLMSTRKLPAYLVGGVWKFDKSAVTSWVEKSGGLDAVRQDVEAQIVKHRGAQQKGRD